MNDSILENKETMTVPWKDISTAPRDGTQIIVYRPGAEEVVGTDHWEAERGWRRSLPQHPPSHWCHHHEIRPRPALEPASVSADWLDGLCAHVDEDGLIGEPAARALLQEVQRLRSALIRIAQPSSCGCQPCTGQCRSQEAIQIEIDGIREAAGAALSSAMPGAATDGR